MNNYRITSNGLKFQVEYQREKGILWWKKKVWEPLGYWCYADIFIAKEYNTKEEAKEEIERQKKVDAAEEQGFIPVDEPPAFVKDWKEKLG